MSPHANNTSITLGIVGAGLMGGGIAQIASQGGVRTLLFDTRDGAAASAKASIATTFDKLVSKKKIDGALAHAALDRLSVAADLQAFAQCDVVIEAIVENLDAKRALFAQLERVVRADCLLATNTSSLSVTAIAAACERPERVGGFHFFSPVPLMKIVEVIDGARTAPWVGERLVALAHAMGHTPVRAKDTPGFIVNHAGRGYGTEALRIAGEGVADFETIDRILRDSVGFRMGPFELLDLTGLDVSHPVMESIYRQYYDEPRFRPSPITRQRLDAGLLGRKTGAGFYRYVDGAAQLRSAALPPTQRPKRVWISRANADAHAMLSTLVDTLGCVVDDGGQSSADALCIVAPLGLDATTAALAEGCDPTRTIAIDTVFGLERHRTLMTTPITTDATRDAAHGLFSSDGVATSVIRDSAGFVAQRTVAHIVNIACDIAQQCVATPADIDRAVTLGLGYPKGPLALGDAIGPARVLQIIDALFEHSRDPRYRASPWLRRRAALGVSLLAEEGGRGAS